MALICTRSVLVSLPSSISRSTSLASDLWWRLSSLGISRSKSTPRECLAGLSHHRRVETQQVWITLQAVFWLQIFVEGKVCKMKLFCFCSLFLIKKKWHLLRLQRKQTFHPDGFISESPASFQRKRTKLLETCHGFKPGPRSQKNSTNTVVVYNWPTACLLLQRSTK